METDLPRYPTVEFLVKHGPKFAIALGLLPVLGGIVLSWFLQLWILTVVGLLAGGILFVVARSYVELVQIIADMLLPK
jgi:hypothetical protein